MSDDKEWKWNPPTQYDKEDPDEWPHRYSIWHDLFITIALVLLVAVVIIVASEVFP
jgi:hypothetical protein